MRLKNILNGAIAGVMLTSLTIAFAKESGQSAGVTQDESAIINGTAASTSDADEANLQAARLVNKAGLGTCVPENGEIYSGAVDFYLAGVVRRLADSAVVGVHSWATGDNIEGAALPMDEPQHQLYLDFYAEVGVPADFYWFTLQAAPAAGMYNMTAEDKVTYKMESM
jgi:hypothetical protein